MKLNIAKPEKKVAVQVSLPQSAHDKIEHLATENEVSKAEVIEHIVGEFLKRNKVEVPENGKPAKGKE